MSEDAAARQDDLFELVCVPIGDYAWHPRLPADEEADRVAELFTSLGARVRHWELSGETPRTRTAVDRRILEWAQPTNARNSVLFWVGHGQANPDGAWLASHETPIAMEAGGVIPEHLAGFIAAEWRLRVHDDDAWAIVVIEACGAERFANLLQSALLRAAQPPRRFAVIGVGADDGAGNLGEFRQALDGALAAYQEGDDAIGLLDLLGQIEDRLLTGTVHRTKLHRPAPLRRRRLLPMPVAATLDTYTELLEVAAGLPPDERSHFLPKAMGADHLEIGEPAWHFVGRERERAVIAAWLRTHDTGMFVVTGPPGSGKSALLGNVVLWASPRLRELLLRTGRLVAAPEGEFDDAVRFDGVIHLAGLTMDGVVERIAAAAGLEDAEPGTVGEAIEKVLTAVARRTRPLRILVDALDEAQDPATIASAVLRRLAAVPGVCLVVGTRASTDRSSSSGDDLLEALGGGGAERLVVGRDPAAIGRYVEGRLTLARESGRLDADPAAIARFAAAVQERDQQFLFARLAVQEAIEDPALLHSAGQG